MHGILPLTLHLSSWMLACLFGSATLTSRDMTLPIDTTSARWFIMFEPRSWAGPIVPNLILGSGYQASASKEARFNPPIGSTLPYFENTRGINTK